MSEFTKEIQQALKELGVSDDLATAYRSTFSTLNGKKVLVDILRRSGLRAIHSDNLERHEGRRSLGSEIMAIVGAVWPAGAEALIGFRFSGLGPKEE